MRENWFPTLNEALASEDLLHSSEGIELPFYFFTGIEYNETKEAHVQDCSGATHYVSIFRDNRGRYERPIRYRT